MTKPVKTNYVVREGNTGVIDFALEIDGAKFLATRVIVTHSGSITEIMRFDYPMPKNISAKFEIEAEEVSE